MKQIVKISLVVALTGLWGCSSKTVDVYSDFASAGHQYAQSLNNVFEVAKSSAIDRASTDLINLNAVANRNDPGFANQQRQRLADVTQYDKKRIEAFALMQRHVQALSRYFQQLDELSKTRYVAEVGLALKQTAQTIQTLSQQLAGAGFAINAAQLQAIGQTNQYQIGPRQRTTLKRRIKHDQLILQTALNTHETLLGIIADDLAHDIAVLTEQQNEWLVNKPFINAQPLRSDPVQMTHWIENRRRLLINESNALTMIEASRKSAQTLNNLLREMVSNERNIAKNIELFRAELDSLTAISHTLAY